MKILLPKGRCPFTPPRGNCPLTLSRDSVGYFFMQFPRVNCGKRAFIQWKKRFTSRRQNVSFIIFFSAGSSAVFHTFLTTMREPSICVTRIFVPFSMKSPSLTTFSRTPSNSPSPVGLSAVVAVPSRPRNTCMSSAER